MIELKNSKTTELPTIHAGRRRFACDCFIGAVQMRGEGEEWQDIKPQLIRDSQGWHVKGAPYSCAIGNDGSRKFYPNRQDKSKYLYLPSMPLFKSLPRKVQRSPAKLDRQLLPDRIIMPTSWGAIAFIFKNTGMRFRMLFREPPLFDRFTLDVDAAGIDIESLLKAKKGVGIPRPSIMEEDRLGEQVQRELEWSYRNGQLELGFDLTGLKFPIMLRNATIDDTVETQGDDGYGYAPSDFDAAGQQGYVGQSGGTDLSTFFRFVNISGLAGATIGVDSYFTVYVNSANTVATNVYCDDSAAPTAPTDWATFAGKARTTDFTIWDDTGDAGVMQSPSLQDPLQEIATDHDPSAIQLLWDNDGGTSYWAVRTYDYNGNDPTLHIDYEEAAVGGHPTMKRWGGVPFMEPKGKGVY